MPDLHGFLSLPETITLNLMLTNSARLSSKPQGFSCLSFLSTSIHKCTITGFPTWVQVSHSCCHISMASLLFSYKILWLRLRAPSAFTVGPGLIPSTHMLAYNCQLSIVSGYITTVFWPLWVSDTPCTHRMVIIKQKMFLKIPYLVPFHGLNWSISFLRRYCFGPKRTD